MENNYKNIGMIYQPHFMSSCFRVACKTQEGTDNNYIVVTCSPGFNGVWKYDASETTNFTTWKNGNTNCYCIPIEKCTKVKELEDITNTGLIKDIKKQQKKWLNSEVKNRDYSYVNTPDWML